MVVLGARPVCFHELEAVAGVRAAGMGASRPAVSLDPSALERLSRSRAVVEDAAGGPAATYGVNTGFGHLALVRVDPALCSELQANLVRSHAMGVGPPLPVEVSRAVVLLRLNSLLKGHSGVRPAVVQLLAAMLNRDLAPVIPSWGSVGASGDLVPLAHLALALLGEGMVWRDGAAVRASDAMAEAGLQPLSLEPKEGLALVNGTEVTLALGSLALARLERVALSAEVAAALSMEALGATAEPFDERLLDARPHPQARRVAANLRLLLSGSPRIRRRGEGPVQDAYSLRAVPAVHGAARESFEWAARVAEVEMASAVDNPLVFTDPPAILSGANFHAQPLAIAWDSCRIGVATLAGIVERRIDRLVNPHLNGGLPPFLTRHSGLRSGLMMAQYVAASLAAECRALASPASVHSIATSAGQEDVVSMGTTAARWLGESVDRLAHLVALELAAGAEAAGFREGHLSRAGDAVVRWVRERVPSVAEEDRPLSEAIQCTAKAVAAGEALGVACQALGVRSLAGFLPEGQPEAERSGA